MSMLSMIIPTRDRREVLYETLAHIERLGDDTLGGMCELVVVDNASAEPVTLPGVLMNGVPIRLIRSEHNLNTAARNLAARHANGEWLLMLDDDSSPLPCALAQTLGSMPSDVSAVGAEIFLPDGRRESGGLPEVIVGCGCAIRRDAFLTLGGYDQAFGYYAEEYDLCAKLIANGSRIAHSHSLRVLHRKSTIGRDMNHILYRLVRNNAWVMQRYAPDAMLEREIGHVLARYERIAIKERAIEGYLRGVDAISGTLREQARTPLSDAQWDRFTGRAAARDGLNARFAPCPVPVRVLGPDQAKGREIIEQELATLGCDVVEDERAPGVVGSLSPGPMLDLHDAHPDAICPWSFEQPGVCAR